MIMIIIAPRQRYYCLLDFVERRLPTLCPTRCFRPVHPPLPHFLVLMRAVLARRQVLLFSSYY
jgi:hypothetical protein